VYSRFSSHKPPSQQSKRTLAVRAVHLQFRGKGIHVHVQILRPRVEIWILSSYWPSQCDRKRICLATSTQPYSQHTIVYTVSTNKIYRVDTESTNIIQLKKKSIRIGKFPLAPMDILASGSAHARPSAQPPHQLQRKKIVARVYKFTFKHLPQHLRSHNQSFGTLGQL
jgi:hypothetical protein